MGTNVLVLCTHNSARSILAQGMLNHWAAKLGADVRAFSAGSSPSGRVNPLALESLRGAGIATEDLRSKGWEEFARPEAPPLRIVVTVCDSAAAEPCPWWSSAPVKAHWGFPDPSNTPGGDQAKRAAFDLTRQALGFRMLQLLRLPLAELDDRALAAALAEIGQS